MYSIVRAKTFDKSYRRLKRSGHLKVLVKESLEEAITALAAGDALPRAYNDHALKGVFSGYRECHIKGDLLLVYQVRHKELVLVLADIGSHSYLFG